MEETERTVERFNKEQRSNGDERTPGVVLR